jgi:hypothetical protein
MILLEFLKILSFGSVIVFSYYSARFALQRSIACARQLLFASIFCLPVLFALLALDKKWMQK